MKLNTVKKNTDKLFRRFYFFVGVRYKKYNISE